MSLISDVSGLANLIFIPVDNFFRLFFFWSPSVLRTFSASMLCLTLGALLTFSGKNSHKILKYLIYFFFACYSFWMLGIITNMENASLLDVNTVMFSILAPICMVIVGKQVAGTKYKGHKLFMYWTMWIIYLIVALLYTFLYPGLTWDLRMIIMMFILLYVFFSLLIVFFVSKIYGGS